MYTEPFKRPHALSTRQGTISYIPCHVRLNASNSYIRAERNAGSDFAELRGLLIELDI